MVSAAGPIMGASQAWDPAALRVLLSMVAVRLEDVQGDANAVSEAPLLVPRVP